ncbi:MAG TPA: hypothetical protein DCZ10_19780, partial [Pelotomaculum sp.]|nr:hypothetical protein [Pelotomaculum sp.]
MYDLRNDRKRGCVLIKQVDIIAIVAKETGIPRHKVEQTVKLLADNTIPFIARYRKE